MLAFAALLYRDMAWQSELRSVDRARQRLRGWQLRRPAVPALSLDGD